MSFQLNDNGVHANQIDPVIAVEPLLLVVDGNFKFSIERNPLPLKLLNHCEVINPLGKALSKFTMHFHRSPDNCMGLRIFFLLDKICANL